MWFYHHIPVRADRSACRLKTRSHKMQQSWSWAVAFQVVFAALHGRNACTPQSVCSEPTTQGSSAMQHGQVVPVTAQNDNTLDFEWILAGCTPRNLLLFGKLYHSHWNFAPSHTGLRSRVLTEVKLANEVHTEWILTRMTYCWRHTEHNTGVDPNKERRRNAGQNRGNRGSHNRGQSLLRHWTHTGNQHGHTGLLLYIREVDEPAPNGW